MKNRSLLVVLVLLGVLNAPVLAQATQEICSVCRVHEGENEPEKVVATASFKETMYGFCSEHCRDTFVESPEAYVPPVFPRPAPAFTVEDLAGNELALAQLKGRVVLLDFWATWCAPCVNDLPKLARLQAKYEEAGLTVVGLSTDEGSDAERRVHRMIKKELIKKDLEPHRIALDDGDAPAWADYLVRVVPSQFLIDAEGQIVGQWSGKTDLALVEDEIVRLLQIEEMHP